MDLKVGNWIESHLGKEGYFLITNIREDGLDLINVKGNIVTTLPNEPKSWFVGLQSFNIKSLSEVDFLIYPVFEKIIKAIFKITR